MKKYILFSLSLFFCFLIEAQAMNLNFRTNFLYSYTYELDGEENNFYFYNSNVNEEAIYSLTPTAPPSYTLDYQSVPWPLEEKKWTEVKALMATTKEATVWESELYYRVIAQMRIWKIVNPELNIKYKAGKYLVSEREPEFDALFQKFQKPDWIDNYLITEDLILDGDFENYEITSETCTITKKSNTLEINSCEEGDNTIKIQTGKKVQKEFQVYQSNQEIVVENGDWHQEWSMNIKREIEIVPPVEPEEPVIPEKPSKPVLPEIPEKDDTHEITNVPKTLEMMPQNYNYLLVGAVLCILSLKYYSRY